MKKPSYLFLIILGALITFQSARLLYIGNEISLARLKDDLVINIIKRSVFFVSPIIITLIFLYFIAIYRKNTALFYQKYKTGIIALILCYLSSLAGTLVFFS